MLILLPPSEGKARPQSGSEVDLNSLSFPELTEHRQSVLGATMGAANLPQAEVLKIFGVSEKLADEIVANQTLTENPCAPAHDIYTGVLFSALDYNSLSDADKNRANQRIIIFSALFGALTPKDQIPAYRLSGSVNLPELGKVATSWAKKIKFDDDFILDCRSGTYQSMWRTKAAHPVKAVTPDGKVVTHFAKHARGLVARALSRVATAPNSLEEAATACNDLWETAGDPGFGHHARVAGNDLLITTPK